MREAPNKPDNFAFIIGAMKSGTTSLFEILSQHPQVCPSRIKEPDYFATDRDESSLDNYLSLWDWRNHKHTIALESSVAYSKANSITGVPERIYKSNIGKYRFIYMIRDPLARIESQVRHGLFAGWGKPLDAGIPQDAVDFSSYAMQLDKYLAFFPMDRIMVVTLEEFKHEPDATLARICQFLELDKNFRFHDTEKRRNSGNFFNAPASIAYITQSSIGQFIAKKLLPAKMKSRLRRFISNLNKGNNSTPSIGRWRLTQEERRLVLNMLADDLNRLETEYGIDIAKYWHIESGLLKSA